MSDHRDDPPRGGTPTSPNRSTAALPAYPSASTASPRGVALGFVGPWDESSSWVATTPAPRSQLRTVNSGRSSLAAIVQCPLPFAAMTKAAPTVSTESRHRGRDPAASTTWVLRHVSQANRVGRCAMWDPSSCRIWRGRVHTHRRPRTGARYGCAPVPVSSRASRTHPQAKPCSLMTRRTELHCMAHLHRGGEGARNSEGDR